MFLVDVYRPEAGNYRTVIWMTSVGIAFQFPLVLVLLIRIGILSVDKLQQQKAGLGNFNDFRSLDYSWR